MKMRSTFAAMLLACGAFLPEAAIAQCCFGDLFACCRKPPVYAVAPVAPVVAPIPAPPPPVMVPVQQTSYVPETTYRTEYKTVPVTTYKPSCEVDPCTGCTRECMQPVTQYVQQAVNVPVTQYRAVTSTKYVQMQPGAPAVGYGPPVAYPAPGAAVAPVPAAGTSPFAAPITTTPQAWGAAGADVSNQIVPGQSSINAPTLPAAPGGTTFQQQRPIAPPVAGQTFIQPPAFTGQPGTGFQPVPAYTVPAPTTAPAAAPALDATTTQRPTQPATPAMPPLKPIPIEPKASQPEAAAGPAVPAPSLPAAPTPASGPAASGTGGMPAVPGTGPTGATGAFPRLLDPTSHTTQWQPANLGGRPATFRPAYPTAALPLRAQQ